MLFWNLTSILFSDLVEFYFLNLFVKYFLQMKYDVESYRDAAAASRHPPQITPSVLITLPHIY